jgi:hypothetical protein
VVDSFRAGASVAAAEEPHCATDRSRGITLTAHLFQHSTKGCYRDSSARSAAFGADIVFRSGAPGVIRTHDLCLRRATLIEKVASLLCAADPLVLWHPTIQRTLRPPAPDAKMWPPYPGSSAVACAARGPPWTAITGIAVLMPRPSIESTAQPSTRRNIRRTLSAGSGLGSGLFVANMGVLPLFVRFLCIDG